MFITSSDVVSRLSSERNIARVLVDEVVREARGLVVIPLSKKTFGQTSINEALKPVIAAVAEVDGDITASETFGVSTASVTRFKKENKEDIEKELEPVRKKAIERLGKVLVEITDEKLQDVGALNLSNIARNLSTVAGNMTKKEDASGGTKYQFNIFAPKVSGLKDYENVIDVN
jgi:hypothetical protein